MSQKLCYSDFIKNSSLLEVEELEDLQFLEIEIENLNRPNYSNRVPIDNKLQVLSNSLSCNGFIGGILVSKTNLSVIDGWQRLQLWQALGNTSIPCHLIHCSSEREKHLHLSFNQQVSEFDLHQFGLEFDNIDFKDFGFDEIEYIDNDIMAKVELEQAHQFKNVLERVKKPSIPCTVAVVQKIDSIKTEKQLQTRNDVLNFLIEIYESNKN